MNYKIQFGWTTSNSILQFIFSSNSLINDLDTTGVYWQLESSYYSIKYVDTNFYTFWWKRTSSVFFYIIRERHLANNNNKLQSSLFKGINYGDVNAAIGECTLDKLNTIEYSNNIRLYIVYSDGSELGPSPGRLGIEFLGKAGTRLNFLRMA